MKPEIPIACSLTDKELQERRKNVLQKTAQFLIEIKELENGIDYRFPAEDAILQDLITVINPERKCRPFLNFRLSLEAQTKTASLELTGQEGTKELVQSLFNWN